MLQLYGITRVKAFMVRRINVWVCSSIKNGGLRTYLLSDDGRDITLYRLSAGDVCVLSASCILKNITFDVHIDAEQDTDLYMVESARSLRAYCRKYGG